MYFKEQREEVHKNYSPNTQFIPVTLKQWPDPIPSRTRPSNAALPMVVLVELVRE